MILKNWLSATTTTALRAAVLVLSVPGQSILQLMASHYVSRSVIILNGQLLIS